ncbi:MAG: tetratricopeptide repeat protein [Candidatus Kuenenia sp.]|nr:tetratricopeptide repeat protein [Candidatus Kuenenia hertensis]
MLILILCASFVVLLTSVGLYVYLKRQHKTLSYIQTVGEYVQQGKYDEAIHLLKETIHKNPRIAEAHAALGMIYNKKDMLDESLQELKTALTMKPDLISIYQEMYKVYKKKGMEEEAQKALESYEKLKGSE